MSAEMLDDITPALVREMTAHNGHARVRRNDDGFAVEFDYNHAGEIGN